MKHLTMPLSDEAIRDLKVGDPVLLSGVMITARDAAHKWLIETFVKKTREAQGDDLEVYEAIKPLLNSSAIYHCGPVVLKEKDSWKAVAAGPTTSIREEPYQAEVIKKFGTPEWKSAVLMRIFLKQNGIRAHVIGRVVKGTREVVVS